MKYAGIIKNDVTAAPGINVTFFTQGCPHHCEGCHNPETWSFEGGQEDTKENIAKQILEALSEDGIKRSLSIMGGEPMCLENVENVAYIIKYIKQFSPETKIYVWTGYLYENLKDRKHSQATEFILKNINTLIDGKFIKELRDITLPMRGSSNQRIINLKI